MPDLKTNWFTNFWTHANVKVFDTFNKSAGQIILFTQKWQQDVQFEPLRHSKKKKKKGHPDQLRSERENVTLRFLFSSFLLCFVSVLVWVFFFNPVAVKQGQGHWLWRGEVENLICNFYLSVAAANVKGQIILFTQKWQQNVQSEPLRHSKKKKKNGHPDQLRSERENVTLRFLFFFVLFCFGFVFVFLPYGLQARSRTLTVTGWGRKFDLQLLSQCGSTYNCLSRSALRYTRMLLGR